MICFTDIKYYIANKLYSSNSAKLIPGYFRKKLLKQENICFVPTKLFKLPENNHPVLSNIDDQKKIINKFNETQQEVTAKTYPDLVNQLKELFDKDSKITFLDFGGEYIDQYLILKRNQKMGRFSCLLPFKMKNLLREKLNIKLIIIITIKNII